MIRIRGRRSVRAEISAVSMTDIAFLLLIFFISTTVFDVERGIPLVLPASRAAPATVERQEVRILRGMSDGRILLDGRPIALEEIGTSLGGASEVLDDRLVSIRMDETAPYGLMIDLLDEVRRTGIRRISLGVHRG